ncbi:phosphatase PAP2 family protein [Streptomyces hilarionis]|uniref:phosphatase PAP2 family protein n=1 Tax=Streptomyces hilarionis TaxID=2839954 RepID=UPI002119E37C|nr:phosphatase PAP2 family protein [Streptomyces hilarionis]MCQ9132379.1 phosphatase PAP2 family protein [Streptomyces hilarionis]
MSSERRQEPVRGGASAASPPVLRGWLRPVAGFAALVVAVLGGLYAGGGEPGGVDRWVSSPTADSVGPPWRRLALVLDFLGEPVGSVLLVAAVVAGCLLLRRPRAAVLAVAGAGVSVGVATALKHLVGRTIHGDGNLSYPSGHTAFATALALAMALLAVGRLGLGRAAGMALVLGAALVAGAAMGWAQVALGAHYPTDTLGGWCTALAVVPATGWLVDRTADRTADRAAAGAADRAADPSAPRPEGRSADAGRRGRH